MVPDLLAATAGDIQAVNLDSPGLPGSDTPAAGRGPTRNRITVVGPLLDTDGDTHLDVVVGAPGFLDAKTRDLDAFWVLRGTAEGMRYQRHFTVRTSADTGPHVVTVPITVDPGRPSRLPPAGRGTR